MKMVKIKDIADLNVDSVGKNYPNREIEYIDISSVGSGVLLETKSYSTKNAPSRAKRLVAKGDTIISTVRPNRRSFLRIKNPKDNWVVSTGFVVLRPKQDVDALFLYYTVTHQKFTDYLTLCAKGAAYPAVDTEIINRAECLLPTFPVQQKIGSILSAYDDLIENNNRRIKILEQMTQTIYDEWFVKFRFPNHSKVKMVDSELGKIPEGWVLRDINDVVAIQGGFAFKSKTFLKRGDYGIVTIKNVQDGKFISKCESYLDEIPEKMPNHCVLSDGDILLSLTGNIGRVCLVYGDKYLLNQRVAKLAPRDKKNNAFVYSLYKHPMMRIRLEQISTGVAQQNLSPIQMSKLKIIYPSDSLLTKYAENCNPMIEEIVVLFNKNMILQETRDILLPKLMSGEIDVEDMDIDIGDVDDR